MATAQRGYKYFQNGYLADGEDPTVYASYGSEEDPESNFGQQVQEANAAAQGGGGGFISPPDGRVMVPGMVGVSQDMVPPPAPPPPNGTGLYFDTDDPGAPGQSNIPIYGAQPPAPHDVGIGSQYSSDLAKEREAVLGAPVRKPPKWWERVAAGALGGAAGWSNAAGRTRNPIDIPSVTQAILYPGYQGKLAEWQSRVLPLQEAAKLSGQQAAVGWKSQQIQSELQLKAAQADAAIKHGHYWEHRAETETNHYRINARGDVVDLWTGQVKRGPPTPKDLYDEAMTIPGITQDQASQYALSGGKLGAPKAPNEAVVKDSQMKADYAATIGKDPAQVSEAEMNGVRRMYGSGDDLVRSASRAFIAKNKRMPTAAEEQKIVEDAVNKRRDPFVDVARQFMMDERKQHDNDANSKFALDEEARLKEKHNADIARVLAPNSGFTSDADKTREVDRINNETRAAIENTKNEYARRVRQLGGSAPDVSVGIAPDGGFTYTPRVPAAPAFPENATTGPIGTQRTPVRVPPTPAAPIQRTPGRGAPPPAQQAANRRPAVGDPVLVDGTKKAVIVGFNPTTGKPILRAQ